VRRGSETSERHWGSSLPFLTSGASDANESPGRSSIISRTRPLRSFAVKTKCRPTAVEVGPIHTVQFSNHTGYGAWKGRVFDGGMIEGSSLYQGAVGAQYGIPITGTPLGLPGPPHIPLGGPAGVQKHTIKNHTHQHYPKPSEKINLHVKQTPGMSYPKPANNAFIHENARQPLAPNRQ